MLEQMVPTCKCNQKSARTQTNKDAKKERNKKKPKYSIEMF